MTTHDYESPAEVEIIKRKARHANKWMLLLAGVALVAGCAFFSKNIQTDAIDGTAELVIQRHDNYVILDGGISEEESLAALQLTVALRSLLKLPEIEPDIYSEAVVPVCDRHDTYIEGDETLTDLEVRIYLRSSAELRNLANLD